MKLRLLDIEGKSLGHIDVLDDLFDAPAKPALVHQVVVGQQANARQGTASTKTRAGVSGGGAKPRPQKGTGGARQGTIRAPHWKGGGVVFGPHPRSYRQRTPKRMRRLSLITVLSEKARAGDLLVLDSLDLEVPKTKEFARILDALDAGPKALLVADGADATVLRSARNIPLLKLIPAALLSTVDLLNHRKVVMTIDAVRKAEELWGGSRERRRKRSAPALAEA